MGADNLLRILTEAAGTDKPSVEEWVERAGTVIYLAALGETAKNDPSTMQAVVNSLVANMPQDLLTVSSLNAIQELKLTTDLLKE